MDPARTVGEPLVDTADPRLYVPRSSSDAVLAGLREWLQTWGRLAIVAGAPGTGTTLLLRMLEQAEGARRRVLFSPFLHIEPDALEHWLIALAPQPPHPMTGDPLLAALRSDGRPTRAPLLLVDDAQSAAPGAVEALGCLVRARAPALRVVLGGCAGRALREAEAAFGTQAVRFELTTWTPGELRALGSAICEHPGLDATARKRLRDLDLDAIATRAHGSARLLKNALTRRCAVASPEPESAAARPELAPPPSIARETEPVREPISAATSASSVPRPSDSDPRYPRAALSALLGRFAWASRARTAAAKRTRTPLRRTAATASKRTRASRLAPAEVPPAGASEEPKAAPVAAPPALAAAPAPKSTPPPTANGAPPRRRSAVARGLAATVAVLVGFTIGLLAGWQYEGDFDPEAPPEAEAQSAEPAHDVAAPPSAIAAAPSPPPEPQRWSVHVNAEPWAWIHIDGEEAGATPLVAPGIPSGAHEFEATFPDGRRERRVLEIGPDSRFVAFR